MNIVARQNTPIGPADAASYLVASLRSIGLQPTQQLVSSLLALHGIETASGQSVQNHSPGNVTAGASWTGDAWRPTWFEVTDTSTDRDKALHAAMLKGQAPSAFRSYPTWSDGWIAWARDLVRMFPEVIRAARSGDPAALQQALSQRYSRDYAKDPARTIQSLSALQTAYGRQSAALGLPSDPLVQDAAASDGGGSAAPPRSLLLLAALRCWDEGEKPAPVLHRGDQSRDVAILQILLPRLTIDGNFGPLTESAVREWQRCHALPVTGSVDHVTWRSLV